MPIVLASLLALGGWIVPWQRDPGLAVVERSHGNIADVLIFAARLDDTGQPVLDGGPAAWTSAVERIHAAGAHVWLTVVNDRVGDASPVLKDADIVHRVLADPESRS